MKIQTMLFFLLPMLACGQAKKEQTRFEKLSLMDGRILENVVIREIGGDYVSVIHSAGAGKIAFENLSKADAESLGLTAEKAEKFRLDEETDKIRIEEEKEKTKAAKAFIDTSFCLLSGRIMQVLSDGFLITDAKSWDGTSYEKGFPRMDEQRFIHLAWQKEIGMCHVRTNPRGRVDGDPFNGIVVLSSPYSYNSALNTVRTVPGFHTDVSVMCEGLGKIINIPKESIEQKVKIQYDPERMIRYTPFEKD